MSCFIFSKGGLEASAIDIICKVAFYHFYKSSAAYPLSPPIFWNSITADDSAAVRETGMWKGSSSIVVIVVVVVVVSIAPIAVHVF